MKKETLKTEMLQKALNLSEQDALKVLIFVSGMNAGKELQVDEKAENIHIRVS